MSALLFLGFAVCVIGLAVWVAKQPRSAGRYMLLAAFLCGAYFTGPFFSNLFDIALNPYFILPKETTVFSFRALAYDQTGSGEHWEYARDRQHYYYSGPALAGTGADYAFTPRSATPHCERFKPLDYSTWCDVQFRTGFGAESP